MHLVVYSGRLGACASGVDARQKYSAMGCVINGLIFLAVYEIY